MKMVSAFLGGIKDNAKHLVEYKDIENLEYEIHPSVKLFVDNLISGAGEKVTCISGCDLSIYKNNDCCYYGYISINGMKLHECETYVQYEIDFINMCSSYFRRLFPLDFKIPMGKKGANVSIVINYKALLGILCEKQGINQEDVGAIIVTEFSTENYDKLDIYNIDGEMVRSTKVTIEQDKA